MPGTGSPRAAWVWGVAPRAEGRRACVVGPQRRFVTNRGCSSVDGRAGGGIVAGSVADRASIMAPGVPGAAPLAAPPRTAPGGDGEEVYGFATARRGFAAASAAAGVSALLAYGFGNDSARPGACGCGERAAAVSGEAASKYGFEARRGAEPPLPPLAPLHIAGPKVRTRPTLIVYQEKVLYR